MSHRSCRIRPPHPYPCRKVSGICFFFQSSPQHHQLVHFTASQKSLSLLSPVPGADKITVADIFGEMMQVDQAIMAGTKFISRKILMKSKSFNTTKRTCYLCLKEKFCIMFRPEGASLNSRSEFFATCRHRLKPLLGNTQLFFVLVVKYSLIKQFLVQPLQ